MLAAGCGRKGPPQTPFILTPAAPTIEAPRRIGDEVLVPVVVPAANLDTSKPAAVVRIDVYGATSLTPPQRARFLEIATLVASIPVAPAGEPGDLAPPPPDPAKGALQGTRASVRDTLTADEMQPRALPLPRTAAARPPATTATPAATVTPAPEQLRRFYMAIAYSPRNRPSPPSAVVELPLTVLPLPPGDLQLGQTPLAIVLDWEPAGGLLGWLLDRALPSEEDPVPVDPRAATLKPAPPPADWLAGPSLYNVYRDVSPDPLTLPPAAAAAAQPIAPVPLNPLPLAAPHFEDPAVADDRERCYTVRTIRSGVEGPASARRCVRVVDLFPPVAPTNLTAISGEGSITLIWEPNVEDDLGGYLVLRSEDGGATLLTLTPTPIPVTQYSDRTARPGVQYTYEVRAVDSRVPVPNTSDSARVVETLR